MMEFFDYDPVTGLEEYIEFADGKVSIHYQQDVSAVLDFAKAHANEGICEPNFRGEAWNYAIIPAVVQMQMWAKGINIADPNDLKKVVQEVNENYPHLKTTHRYHAL